eukprot:Em0004g304a
MEVTRSWKSLSKNLVKQPTRQDVHQSLEEADPELCIAVISRALNFTGLKHRLKSVDGKWLEQFLSLGGLSALFDALESLGRKGFSSISDALRQLECVGCVKAVMNNEIGLTFIIESQAQNFVQKLAQVLDTNNGLLKTQIFELFSALCVYSPEGWSLVLEALENYKRTKGLRYRFSLPMHELRSSETDEYSACVLAFINCVLQGCEDLKQRCRLRNEIIALGLSDLLVPMREKSDDALATQIEVFEAAQLEDTAHIEMPGMVDINSHEDMFRAVLDKIWWHSNEVQFLHILQNLLLIERDSVRGEVIWNILEELCS